MDEAFKERRRMSQAGLIDAIIQTVGQLASAQDLMTRSIANRALADLRKLRSGMHTRRANDRRTGPDRCWKGQNVGGRVPLTLNSAPQYLKGDRSLADIEIGDRSPFFARKVMP